MLNDSTAIIDKFYMGTGNVNLYAVWETGGTDECYNCGICGCYDCFPIDGKCGICVFCDPRAQMLTYISNPPVSVTVTGTVPADDWHYSGDTVTVAGNPGNLAAAGYVFKGWSFRSDANAPWLSDTFVMGLEDATLYAVWHRDPYGPNLIVDSSRVDDGWDSDWNNQGWREWPQITSRVVNGADVGGRTTYLTVSDNGDPMTVYIGSSFEGFGPGLYEFSVWVYVPSTATSATCELRFASNPGIVIVVPATPLTAGTWTEVTGRYEITAGQLDWHVRYNIHVRGAGNYNVADYYVKQISSTGEPTGPFNVSYDGNLSGSSVSNMPAGTTGHAVGSKITVSTTIPSAEDYIFKGWGMLQDGTPTINEFFMGTGDVTLYAVWEEEFIECECEECGCNECFPPDGKCGTCDVCDPKTTVIIGDVNGDGVVNLFDAQRLLQWINSGVVNELSPIMKTAADTNGDGVVDLFDAQRLLQWINSGGVGVILGPNP